MKKYISIVIICLIAVNSFFASTAHTKMRNITALQLTADMGIGWNLGNSLDARCNERTGINTELCWGNPKTSKAIIDMVKQKGFKTIRIPTTWSGHFGAAPNYTIDQSWFERVEEVVNYAFENDMYVILNIHHESENWSEPSLEKKDSAKKILDKVWTQIANRFNKYGDYLILETLNEPRVSGTPTEWTGGTAEARAIVNEYNLVAVNAIRATGGNNATRFLMVPTHAASGNPKAFVDFVIPNNDPKIIVSIHFYEPYVFAQQYFPNKNELGNFTWGSEKDKQIIIKGFELFYQKFIANGTAVVIGEWGTKDKQTTENTDSRATHAEFYVKTALSKQIPPLVWDDGGAKFQLLDRHKLQWKYPSIVDAIIRGSKN